MKTLEQMTHEEIVAYWELVKYRNKLWIGIFLFHIFIVCPFIIYSRSNGYETNIMGYLITPVIFYGIPFLIRDMIYNSSMDDTKSYTPYWCVLLMVGCFFGGILYVAL